MCRRGSELSGSNAACWGCGDAGCSLRFPVVPSEPEIKYLLLLCLVLTACIGISWFNFEKLSSLSCRRKDNLCLFLIWENLWIAGKIKETRSDANSKKVSLDNVPHTLQCPLYHCKFARESGRVSVTSVMVWFLGQEWNMSYWLSNLMVSWSFFWLLF